MAKLSEAIKNKKDESITRFFGEHQMLSNQYFTFNRIQHEDEIILITNNLKSIKGNPVLIVGNNQAVYLKDWNVVPVMNWDEGIDAYAVKLNRKYFKIYTFKSDFEGYDFDQPETFDSLLEAAKEQQTKNMKIRVKSWTYSL